MSWDVERLIELYSGAITANFNGTAYPVRSREKGTIFVNVSAVSGTTPTLVLTLQASDDETDWYDVAVVIDDTTEGDLTRVTAPTTEAKIVSAGKYYVEVPSGIGRYIRIKGVVGGTTPSFTCTVTAILK